MKPNQTSKTNGIENILIPMENFNCTQGDFQGNHPYYACDMAGKDTGREPAYFPFSAKCVAINVNDGNAVWWESQNKVRFADGTIDYCTIMVLHDVSLDGIYINATYPQGHQMAIEGNKMGTNFGEIGNHLHIEIAKGKFSHMYDKNSKGYYLPRGMAIEKACFKDGTNFINSANWDWKSTADIKIDVPAPTPPKETEVLNSIPSDFVHEKATFKVTNVNAINIRKAPSLKGAKTGQVYELEMSVNYDGYVKRDGYVWISWISVSTNQRHWMTVGELDSKGINAFPYGKFI